MRIALLAEGSGEIERVGPVGVAPGEPLLPEDFGPAHALVACLVSAASRIPESAVTFVAPLRDRGRLVRGSGLHRPRTLRRLLTYPDVRRSPDLAVALVDEDDDTERRRELQRALVGLTQAHVLAVAVREFEAWLVSDHRAVADVVGATFDPIDAPEGLSPGEAKARLHAVIPGDRDEREVRSEIARRLDLDLVARRSPSFRAFRDDLARAFGDLQT